MNNCCFTGNLVRDAESKFKADSGKELITFTIAVNNRRLANGKWTNDVMFMKCSKYASGKLLPHLLKGTSVAVVGSIKQNKWEQNGQKRSEHQMLVSTLDLNSRREDGTSTFQHKQGDYDAQNDYTDPARYQRPPKDDEWVAPDSPEQSDHPGSNPGDEYPDLMY